jgi:hypothetical protein
MRIIANNRITGLMDRWNHELPITLSYSLCDVNGLAIGNVYTCNGRWTNVCPYPTHPGNQLSYHIGD